MSSDPIRVATEVLAAWDARFDDLLFPTREGPRQESPPMVTQPGVRFPPDLGHQTGPVHERGWGLYMQRGYFYVWQLSCFPQHPHSHYALIMGEVTWGMLWSVFGRWFLCQQYTVTM